jgi:tryptophan 2,3-dioxygenase
MDAIKEDLIKRIEEKYLAIDQNANVHLEGLVWSNPMTYWDYIMPEALLGLQIQRTNQPDEMVFILYHQINELLFKMILWEINQVSDKSEVTVDFFTEKLRRISRYFDMLTSSFSIMGDGMEAEQYMKFRNTLTPASGFQSAQYRQIEFASTDICQLVDGRFRQDPQITGDLTQAYEHLYWHAAGKDHRTGKKNTLLQNFEKKYKEFFLREIQRYKTSNLWSKFKQLPEENRQDPTLIGAMRHYDYTVNITWVMAHYHAAAKYLGEGEATGGSDWRKYMLPRYQKRIFFPDVWTAQEIETWGHDV